MRRAWRWLAAHPWITSLVLVVLVTGGAAITWRLEVSARYEFSACVARWADATAARSVALGKARSEVDLANDALWRGFAALLANPPPDARDRFTGLLDSYVGASDRYAASLRDNPAPPPPRLGCGR
ncbi:MAG TPA: hypothetical protein VJ769_09510 [Actinomycetes bacterium]|nr:hypothetical protein [Actinomycetes bacterium]